MKSAAGPTVFIIDDDRGMRQAIQDLVESVGLRAEAFATGQAAATSLDLIVVALLIRINVLIHENLQALLQVLHFAAEREIHVCRLSPIYP